MYGRWQLHGQFHRLVVNDGTELELCHVRPPLPFVRLKHEIAVNDHADRKPRPDRQCRLDVEILLNDLLSSLVRLSLDPRRSAEITSLLLPVPVVDPSSLPTPSNVDKSAALNRAPQ
jgi:hypothetical protein